MCLSSISILFTVYSISYRIGILTLIKWLKSTYPDITQPWYTDDSGALGTFDNLERYFISLKCNGPYQGYYPKPTKMIMIMNPKNLEVGRLFGQYHGFKVCAGTGYLDGYIRNEKSKGDWLKKRTDKWESDIHVLRKRRRNILRIVTPWQHAYSNQSGYFAMHEKGFRTGVCGSVKFLMETFLPCLFFKK